MQLGIYIDQKRCNGCLTCVVACKDWHDVPAGTASWMRVKTLEQGEYPHPRVDHMPLLCFHCAEPRCALICPTGAITKREKDGVVIVDRNKCRTVSGCGIIATTDYGRQQAPCKISCPVHLSAPAYINLIAREKFKEARDIIRQEIPLPGVVGRICHHPCEAACKRQELDEPLAICALKRFVSDIVDIPPTPMPITQKEKIAVVGSGPAGLSAAYFLVKKGYRVTVFESASKPGGMLMAGIPRFRLPREIVQGEIEYIKRLGVRFRLNTPVGIKLSLEDIRSKYDALFLATGAPLPRKLDIDGADLKGVTWGIDFLRRVNTCKPIPVKGKKVVVIGGGNVAIDTAMTAGRSGASEVQVFCLESRNEVPALETEVKLMREEGITLNTSWGPVRINGKSGRVDSIDFIRCTSVFNKQGRFSPCYDRSEKVNVKADMVILAIGQASNIGYLSNYGVSCTSGWIRVNRETMETSVPGIFAGGDVTNGTGFVIDAIAAGRKAADSIDVYLRSLFIIKQPITAAFARPQELADPTQIKVDIPATVKKQKRQKMPVLSVRERTGNFDEIARSFSAEAAVKEAKRCLNCAGHLCLEACPYGAPQFTEEENARMQKCDLCQDRLDEGKPPICVAACPMRALVVDTLEKLEGATRTRQTPEGFIYSESTKPSVIFKAEKLD